MKHYPEIPGSSKARLGVPCIAFYKYDGSNLRWEWSPKRGWYKFGYRTQLFDASHPLYSQAIPIFMERLSTEIVRRVKDVNRNCQRIIAYTEFFGEKSFAGQHDLNEPKQLRLIDIELYKKGMMSARQFVEVFGDMSDAAEVIYQGNMNKQFIDDVRQGKYPVWEGVVAKGDGWMCKIKTNAFFQKLNEVYGTNYRQYWE